MKFLEPITKKAKRILIIGVLINLGLVFFVGAATYIINIKSNYVESIKKDIWINEEKTKKLEVVKRLIEEMKEDLDTLDSYFTNEDEVVLFIEDIENMGAKSGVSLSLRSVNVDKENGGSLYVSLIASGSWESVYHFLNLLELFPANIHIDKVSFTKKERSDSGIWVGDFSLSLLSFSEK